MTLREALQTANLSEVYRSIYEKDQGNVAECDRPSLETTIRAYSKVVEELLSKPSVPPYEMSWIVKEEKDWYDGHKYIDVCFLNPNYIAPTEGLKPWGGDDKTPIPDGHYDCNDNKHNQYFAAGFTKWSVVIDTPIVNGVNLPLEKMLAELLWELTFYGWTEKKQEENVAEIERRCEEAKDEVERGNYTEILPDKEGQLSIIIPDSLKEILGDIPSKEKL